MDSFVVHISKLKRKIFPIIYNVMFEFHKSTSVSFVISLSDHVFFVWLKQSKTFDDKQNFYIGKQKPYQNFHWTRFPIRKENWIENENELWVLTCDVVLKKIFSFSCWPELGARWPCFSSFFPGFFTTTVKASRTHRARAHTALLSYTSAAAACCCEGNNSQLTPFSVVSPGNTKRDAI